MVIGQIKDFWGLSNDIFPTMEGGWSKREDILRLQENNGRQRPRPRKQVSWPTSTRQHETEASTVNNEKFPLQAFDQHAAA